MSGACGVLEIQGMVMSSRRFLRVDLQTWCWSLFFILMTIDGIKGWVGLSEYLPRLGILRGGGIRSMLVFYPELISW